MSSPIVPQLGLSHIALRVRDVEHSIAWYRAVLGYEVLTNGHAPTPDRTRSAMGLIANGAIALELLQTAGSGQAPGPDSAGVAGISLTVADVAAAVEALQASAHKPLTGVIVAEDWRIAFIRDPDGTVIEFVQQPEGARSIAEFAPELRARRDGSR